MPTPRTRFAHTDPPPPAFPARARPDVPDPARRLAPPPRPGAAGTRGRRGRCAGRRAGRRAPPPGPDETPHERLKRRMTARRVADRALRPSSSSRALARRRAPALPRDRPRPRARAPRRRHADRRAVLADDATIRVARVDGNFLTGARLVGFEVERGGEVLVPSTRSASTTRCGRSCGRTFSASDLTHPRPAPLRAAARGRHVQRRRPAAPRRPRPAGGRLHRPHRPRAGPSTAAPRSTGTARDRDSTLVLDAVARRRARLRLGSGQPPRHARPRSGWPPSRPARASRMGVAGSGRFSRSEVVLRRLAAQSTQRHAPARLGPPGLRRGRPAGRRAPALRRRPRRRRRSRSPTRAPSAASRSTATRARA